jgi:phage baseplate assembly protein W
MVEVTFPYRLDARGATATAGYDDHVEQMVELLLLTRPGERVNLPAFGCGLLDMVFAPNSPEIAAALDVTIAAAVNLWLGDVISLSSLEVTSVESELQVQLSYTVLATGTPANMMLAIPGAA